jgi:hypothetical protein
MFIGIDMVTKNTGPAKVSDRPMVVEMVKSDFVGRKLGLTVSVGAFNRWSEWKGRSDGANEGINVGFGLGAGLSGW